MKNYKWFVAALFLVAVLMPLSSYGKSGTWELKFTMDADKSGLHLLYPGGLYVDHASERYYIVDSGRNRLLSFDKDGMALGAFSAGGKLENPVSMVKDSTGRMLVSEKGKGSVTLIDLKKKKVTPFFIKDVYPQRLQIVKDVVYLLDKRSGSVFSVDNEFNIKKQFTCADCTDAGFVDFKILQNAMYCLSGNGELFKFDLSGKQITSTPLDPPPDFAAAFTVSSNGQFFVVERHIGSVLVYHANGKFDYSFLRHGKKADQLYYPSQIDFDPWGRLCIVDEGNGRVGVFAR